MNAKHKIKNTDIWEVIRRLSGQSNILTIPRLFIDLTGDIDAALFLSQCIYWSDKTDNHEGWFYKTREDWYEELGFTRRRLYKSRRILELIVTTNRFGQEAHTDVVWYRVEFNNLIESITDLINDRETKGKWYKTYHLSGTKRTALVVQNVPLHKPVYNDLTETTALDYATKNTLAKKEKNPPALNYINGEKEKKSGGKFSSFLYEQFNSLGIYSELIPQIENSKWTEDQLAELIKSIPAHVNYPAGVFMWRLNHWEPGANHNGSKTVISKKTNPATGHILIMFSDGSEIEYSQENLPEEYK